MKNGAYVFVIAPEDYPGKKYRGRYAYEHTVEFWKKTGRIPFVGHVIHHKNENKRDNSWDNLEEKSNSRHIGDHTKARAKLVHGTLNAYDNYKCRCVECRKKKTSYANEYRWRKGIRKRRIPKVYTHGTRAMYVHKKCRCTDCRKANTDYHKSLSLRDSQAARHDTVNIATAGSNPALGAKH